MDHDVENAFQRLETEDEPSIGQSVLRPMVLSLIPATSAPAPWPISLMT